jgi:cytochrome c oxidase subunit 2
LWLLTIFFTTVVLSLLLFFAVRYRRGSKVNRARPVDEHLTLELTWSIIPLILGLAIFAWGARLYAQIYKPPANATEIFVIGKQWMWHLQHANGVRENNELHVPVGKPVKLTMISQDVIHSFFIPAFRMKRDVVPGRYTNVWFTPTKRGKYRLLCTEYCGTQHSLMGGWVYVMSPDEYQQWLITGGSRQVAAEGSLQNTSAGGRVEASGENLFNQFGCTSCHGMNAVARGPSLVGLYGSRVELRDGTAVRADESYIRESILYPNAKITRNYQPIMPAYKGQMSEEQVIELVNYIRSLSNPDAARAAGGAGGDRSPQGARTDPQRRAAAAVQQEVGAGSRGVTQERVRSQQGLVQGARTEATTGAGASAAGTDNIQSEFMRSQTAPSSSSNAPSAAGTDNIQADFMRSQNERNRP